MGKVNKLIKILLVLIVSIIGTAKAASQKNDTLQAFTMHKNNNNPIVVFDGIKGKIIAKIYPNQIESTGHIFKILDSKNGWFKINLNLTNVETWVKAGALAINSKNYDDVLLTIFNNPSIQSKEVYKTNLQVTLLLMDISSEWIKVQLSNKNGKIALGWIKRDMACGNPYTTCN
jgi:hypothetical protein